MDLPWYGALVPSSLMGAAAAFVAVFVLLGTNTQEILRVSGVALLAGHFWSPVFEAGKEYVLAQPEREVEAAVAADTAKLTDGTAQLDKSSGDANLARNAGRLAESLTDQVAYMRPGAAKAKAQAAIARSLDVIGAKAQKDDAEALSLIESVGETAARTGNQRISERCVSNIGRIPATQGGAVEARKKEFKLRYPGPR
jgi:hypothetical protein